MQGETIHLLQKTFILNSCEHNFRRRLKNSEDSLPDSPQGENPGVRSRHRFTNKARRKGAYRKVEKKDGVRIIGGKKTNLTPLSRKQKLKSTQQAPFGNLCSKKTFETKTCFCWVLLFSVLYKHMFRNRLIVMEMLTSKYL